MRRVETLETGSACILFTTKTRRIAKDFFASSCLRGEIFWVAAGLLRVHLWFPLCFWLRLRCFVEFAARFFSWCDISYEGVQFALRDRIFRLQSSGRRTLD